MEFVDTNIILYAYDAGAGARHVASAELVGHLGRRRKGVLSIQVLQEFYVNAVSKIATRLSPERAQQKLRALGRWPVHSPLPRDVLAAGALSEEHRISFWDAMILRSAAEMGCDVLWTEDLNSGQVIGGVRIRDPFD